MLAVLSFGVALFFPRGSAREQIEKMRELVASGGMKPQGGRRTKPPPDLRYLGVPEPVCLVLGDNLRSAGRFEEASLILERAQREDPTFPQPLISLADLYARRTRGSLLVENFSRS